MPNPNQDTQSQVGTQPQGVRADLNNRSKEFESSRQDIENDSDPAPVVRKGDKTVEDAPELGEERAP